MAGEATSRGSVLARKVAELFEEAAEAGAAERTYKLKGSNDSLRAERDKLKAEVASLAARLAEQAGRAKAAEGDKDWLKGENAQLRVTVDALQRQLVELQRPAEVGAPGKA